MVQETVERWRYFVHSYYRCNPQQAIEQFVGQTGFLAAANRWTPHLVEEVKGVAEGATIDFDTIFALQLMDEGGWYLGSLGSWTPDRCSSLGCDREGGRPALLAQNLDWVNIFEGLAVLLYIRYPDSTLEVLAPTVAGVIGTCGLSNRPVGVCTNALWSALNNSTDGLVVNFVLRAVLEQENLEAARAFLERIQHASGENFMIGDAERVATFECSANQVVRWTDPANAGRVYHTNHPLANDDLIFPPLESGGGGTSHARFRFLAYRLRKDAPPIRLDTFKHILSSHQGSICAHHRYGPTQGYTFCSAIYDLSASPELHLTVGPPCSNTWQRFSF
jgi:predicted choloylglycine hydrolase